MAVSLSQHKHMSPRSAARLRRQVRVRKKVFGAPGRPRLVVTRSARHIYAQVIDDTQGRTLASASTMEAALRAATGDKSEKAKQVGGSSPSVPRLWASRVWSSTAPATSTTGALRPWRTGLAKVAWDSDTCTHCSRDRRSQCGERWKVERIDWNPAPHWRCRWGASRP